MKKFTFKQVSDLKIFIQLFFSHHPSCKCYKNHVFSIKVFDAFGVGSPLRVCAGCLFAGVGIIASILLFVPIYFALNNPLSLVLFSGLLMLASFFWMHFSKSNSPVHHRATRKFMLGFGLPLYYYTSFLVHWLFVAVFMISIPVYAYYSINHHEAIDKKCKHKGEPTPANDAKRPSIQNDAKRPSTQPSK